MYNIKLTKNLRSRLRAYFFLLHAPLRRNQIPGVRQHVGICSEAILRLNVRITVCLLFHLYVL